MDAVLVLNADLGPLHRVSFRHAIRMLVREVAEVHEADPDRVIGVWPMAPRGPARAVHRDEVALHRRTGVVPLGRDDRDRHTCAYCGGTATTVDHVVSSSRGGRSTWTNTVVACGGCNQRKGDRTPAVAGMVLRVKPYAPTWASLAAIARR